MNGQKVYIYAEFIINLNYQYIYFNNNKIKNQKLKKKIKLNNF